MKTILISILYVLYVIYGLIFSVVFLGFSAIELVEGDGEKTTLIVVGFLGPILLFLSTFEWLFRSRKNRRWRHYRISILLYLFSPIWMAGWMCSGVGDFGPILFVKRALMFAVCASPLIFCMYLHNNNRGTNHNRGTATVFEK